MATKKIRVCIDMDGVLCNYEKSWDAARIQYPETAYPQSEYGFFAELEPIAGALNGIRALVADGRYDVWILTSPSTKNPFSYTEKRAWVGKNLGYEYVLKLALSPDKSVFKGAYLVDDIKEGCGVENFEGTLIHFGSSNYPNWDAVLNKFLKEE